MNDQQNIADVLIRYASGIDSRDWDGFRSCFTEQCSLDYGTIGRWNNVAAFTCYMKLAHAGPSLHRLSNFTICVQGDQAFTRSYVDALVYGPGGWTGAQAIGYYDDRLIRTADGWKITERCHTSIRLKFLGILSVIPAGLASCLATFAAQRLYAKAQAGSHHKDN